MKKPRVYIDSDVIIFSLMSKTGAASFIFNLKNIDLLASNYSKNETKVVAERLGLKIVSLGDSLEKIKEEFSDYVIDENDAHIATGAVKVKAQFLISYNLRHFKAGNIKTDFDILLMTPAMFLQYLRSR